jgi:crotonobetainyl-CoA:carnitine CoA-transferase CaiB-like acyl-CoA transferase
MTSESSEVGRATDLPLHGIRVIEFAQMVAAPAAGLLLADYGADVIKVEPPEGDSARQLRTAAAAGLPASPVFLAYNRGKRLIRLDLRNSDDLATARRLIAEADVLIESSRPGAMDRLGLGASEICVSNPRLIYASVSGFGWTPSARDKRGVDLIVQAESGIMSTTGPFESPMKVGFTVVDAACGHALCHGILAALYQREKTGRGDVIKISLYDVALHLQSGPLVEYLMTGKQMPRSGNSAPLTAPADLMRCSEGAIVVSAYLEPHWIAFTDIIGAPHLRDDERYRTSETRIRNRVALLAEIEARLATRTASEWEKVLDAAGLLVGQVKDYAQVVQSPFTTEAAVIGRAGENFGVHNPARLSGDPRSAMAPHREIQAAEANWLTAPCIVKSTP